ncbi:hypothetical protein BN961_02778 [Afipia felis]|uniref:Uncharacterized protein n=1 Tax=Afipia felis TaxID=1035 RepID=A0A090N816_AFIFE|nr:hypothetical protein BN961_02778 [Afipia felis]
MTQQRDELLGATSQKRAFFAVELGINILEVEHMRPVQDCGIELGRFDRILSAVWNERAAHEHHRRDAIEQPEFAHRIGNIDIRICRRQIAARAQLHLQAGDGSQLRNGRPALWMTRHNDREKRRNIPGQTPMRVDDDLLLAGMGRSRDENRPPSRRRFQPFEPLGIGRQRLDVELEIAGSHDIGTAERSETFVIDVGLREAQIEARQQRRDGAARPAPARKRTRRHAPVDQDERHPPVGSRQQQVRPEIGFNEQRKTRLPVIEKALDESRDIEGNELMNDIRRKTPRDDLRRRARARSQKDAQIERAQPIDQFRRREHLADARAMNPDERSRRPREARTATTLINARRVFLALPQPASDKKARQRRRQSRRSPVNTKRHRQGISH